MTVEEKIRELEGKIHRLEHQFDSLAWIKSPKEIYSDISLPKPVVTNSKENPEETHVK